MFNWLKSKEQKQADKELAQAIVEGVQEFLAEMQSEGVQTEATFYCGCCGHLPLSQYPHDCPNK